MENDDNKIMTQPERVARILNQGCEYFGITKEALATKCSGGRSKNWYIKRFFITLLVDNTALTTQEIAEYVGLRNHSTVLFHYKNLKEDVSGKLYGSQKTKMIYTELLSYLNLNSYETTEKD